MDIHFQIRANIVSLKNKVVFLNSNFHSIVIRDVAEEPLEDLHLKGE